MGSLLTTISTAVILAGVTAFGLYLIRLLDGGRLAAEVTDLAAAVRDLRAGLAALGEDNAALRARLAALEAELCRLRAGGGPTGITDKGGSD